ncbi:MAG: ankyrin repeat domain-containing protein [Gammaproteobacteria bacterium]|nr:ankyrin repeat domain-containing protein [Gammaproteobacteria bacterium]
MSTTVAVRLPEAKEAKEEKKEAKAEEKSEQKASQNQAKLNAELLEAAKQGNLDAVQRLVTAGASVANAIEIYSCMTALLWAAYYGHTTTVEWLLGGHGARLDEKDNSGKTALLGAAFNGHTATAESLLRHGARIDERDNFYSWTALLGAAYYGHTTTVEWLLNNSANIRDKDVFNRTAVDLARLENHPETVAFLESRQKYSEAKFQSSPPTLSKAVYLQTTKLHREEPEPYAQYKVGQCCEAERNNAEALLWYQKAANRYPPALLAFERLQKENEAKDQNQAKLNAELLEAAKKGNLDAVQRLVTAGASVANAIEIYSCMTALLWAAYYGHTTTVEWLLGHGARLDEKDEFGGTALLLAAGNGHTATVEWLLGHGARIDEKDEFGRTALLLAAGNGYTATVEWLLGHGAKIDESGDSNLTALLAAAYSGQTATVEWLLRHGARIDEKDEFGRTALLGAAGNGYTATVEWLLNNGANIRDKNNKSKTAVDLARLGNHPETVAFLERWQKHLAPPSFFQSLFGPRPQTTPSTLSKADYIKVLERAPDEPYSQYRVGRYCEDEKNFDGAILWYQKSQAKYPKAHEALERLQKIRRGDAKAEAKEVKTEAKEAKSNPNPQQIVADAKVEANLKKNEAKVKEEKSGATPEAKEGKATPEAKETKAEIKAEAKSSASQDSERVASSLGAEELRKLMEELNKQKDIMERLADIKEAKGEVLDAKSLIEKEQELNDHLQAIPSAKGAALALLQKNAAELKQVIEHQRELNTKDEELKIINQDGALKDYYNTFLILLTGSVLACKVIHSKAGPAQVANAKMDTDDCIVSFIRDAGSSIPIIGMFSNIIAGAHSFLSGRNKLQKINKIVVFLPTTTDGDIFAETLARRLTFAQESELKKMSSDGLMGRALRAAKSAKCWLTADDINNPVRELAKTQCEVCLSNITDQKFTSPADLKEIPIIVVTILGKRPVLVPHSQPQPSASIGFFSASCSNVSVQVAPADTKEQLAKLLSEQEKLRKSIQENEEKVAEAAKIAVRARQDAREVKESVSELGVSGGSSMQVFANALTNPHARSSYDDLKAENATLHMRLTELERTVSVLSELTGHTNELAGVTGASSVVHNEQNERMAAYLFGAHT